MNGSRLVLSLFLITMIYSIQLFAKAESRQTEFAIAWYNKAHKSNNPDEKIKCYKEAIKLVPTFIEAHYYLGHVYKNLRQFENALEAYTNALNANPSKLKQDLQRTILFESGMIYQKLNKFSEAEKTFLEAYEIAADNSVKATILNLLGSINSEMGNYEKAISYFQKGIEIYPVNKNSFDNSIEVVREKKKINDLYADGLTNYNQENYNKAISFFQKVVEINPNFKDVDKLLKNSKEQYKTTKLQNDIKKFYDHGISCIRKENWPEAVEAFELVCTKIPNYENGEAERYLTLAKQKLEKKNRTNSLEKFYRDGNIAVQRGDYINAIIAYERVSEIDPNYKNIKFKIQQLLQKTEGQDNNILKSKYYSQGIEALEKEDYHEALNIFNRLYALDNNYEDITQLIDKAKRKIASSTKQGTIDIYYQKGLDFYNEANWFYALINFEKVHMLDQNYKDVQTLMTQAKKNFEGDDSQLATAVPSDSKRSNPLLVIGIIITSVFIPFWAMVLLFPTARARFYLLQKRYDKAGQIYERMLHNNPQNVKLYISLANIYMNENRKDPYAIRIFKKAMETNVNENLKQQLIPILNQHYLEQGKNDNSSSLGFLEDSLKEELKNMGK